MRLYCLFILAFYLSLGNVFSQEENRCSCCTENHQAFDFWLGEWSVYNAKGKIVGTNKIIKMQDKCVLQENWEAANGTHTGTSYNYFNEKDSTWNQLWISNSGNILELKGRLNNEGEMVLKSNLQTSEKGTYYNQITWSENKDGSVTQRWDLLNDEGEKIKTVFEGFYRKK